MKRKELLSLFALLALSLSTASLNAAAPEVKVLVSALSPIVIRQSSVSILFAAELQTGVVSFQPVGIGFRARIKEKRGADIVPAEAFRDIGARAKKQPTLYFPVYTSVQFGTSDVSIYADLTKLAEMSPYDTETIFFAANLVEKWETGDEIEVEQLTLLGELSGFAGQPSTAIAVIPESPVKVAATVQGYAARITGFRRTESALGGRRGIGLTISAECLQGSTVNFEATTSLKNPNWVVLGGISGIPSDRITDWTFYRLEGTEEFALFQSPHLFVRISTRVP